MKTFLYTVGAVLAALLLWTWWKNRMLTAPTVQTEAMRNAQSNSTLSSYQDMMPIAQLSRVPWTTTNLRMVDPIIEAPISLPLIPQNGGY